MFISKFINKIRNYFFKRQLNKIDRILQRIDNGEEPENFQGFPQSDERLKEMEESCQNVKRYAEEIISILEKENASKDISLDERKIDSQNVGQYSKKMKSFILKRK